MPDAVVTAADVIGQSLYAVNSSVPVYASDYKTVKYTVAPGQYICTVWSWTEPDSGGIYWLFYRTTDDYNNQIPSFVKQDSNLSLPALPGILDKIAAQKKAAEIQSKGLLQYYLDTYGKWIIIAIVVAVAAVPIVRSFKTATSKSVSGTDNKQALMWLSVVVVGGYLLRKKYKGSIIVDPLDKGEFVPDVVDSPIYIDATGYPSTMAGIKRRKATPLMI